MTRWQFWIDRGGTFTDVVGRTPGGALQTLKLLSEDPDRYADAAVEGIRRMLGLTRSQAISAAEVESVKMGTTVATNALLQRRGERVVLVTTSGFRDALRIATQARPRLFARQIVLPEMLYERVIEANERIGANGELVAALDKAALQNDLQRAHEAGIRACAIVLLHGFRFPGHELAAAAVAEAVGFTQISVSHRVSPLMKLVPRGDTTVADAYLSPVLGRYVAHLAAQMPGVRLLFMQSSGGLTDAARFRGKDAVLSGPAGGIVGMVCTATAAGHERVIGFDMGGTSTDVSHYAGSYERVFDTEVAGVRLRAPMLNIHTIAAGGGSIIVFDGARLRVGPDSAGAQPGPASYRRGGPLTITDANIFLGRIQPHYFPAVFGAKGDLPLDADVVARGFAELVQQMTGHTSHTGHSLSPAQVAGGSLQIAVGAMANAVKRISVARGHDVTRYTLQCFGGAGGQHACLVADELGIERVFCHALGGVLSAIGMGLADQHAMREASLESALDAPGIEAEFSTNIAQEGVLIDNFKVVAAGVFNESDLWSLLTRGPYPARNPAQNIADLRAQIAANEKGALELRRMVAHHGVDRVTEYMRHVQDNAEWCVRKAISALRDGHFALTLDNGSRIQVAVRVGADRRSACIDFTGTSAQLPDNFNAPRAVTVAAVLYVFRTLVDDDIPLNAGCLKPLEIIVPEGSMLNPRPPAAVVAGNVETSTCVTNALYGALGLMAAGQCTMNNFTFGDARHQYYETIAGGSGAGPQFEGASVVQTHMTNSRLTDPEVLECRYPVRLESFEIRPASGGDGRWRGGNGGVRRMRFLEPMTAAILSNGRRAGAFGMAGGGAGECGRNSIERVDGRVEILEATGQATLDAGDVFVISTPGGGGYGERGS